MTSNQTPGSSFSKCYRDKTNANSVSNNDSFIRIEHFIQPDSRKLLRGASFSSTANRNCIKVRKQQKVIPGRAAHQGFCWWPNVNRSKTLKVFYVFTVSNGLCPTGQICPNSRSGCRHTFSVWTLTEHWGLQPRKHRSAKWRYGQKVQGEDPVQMNEGTKHHMPGFATLTEYARAISFTVHHQHICPNGKRRYCWQLNECS